MIDFCQFGAGRIGAIHAGNIAGHPHARLKIVVDTDRAAAERLAARYGARVGSQAEALADSAINAVVIASSTDTHADLVEAAARAGKGIFCEKPLDLDRRRAEACVAVTRECGVPLMVGFNRRFDPHFAKLEREIRAGRIGRAELLTIKSYDPALPSIAFVRRSGGLFRDMMIHDLDMACWLLAEEPVEIFARGSVLVDPAIGEAGDFDTAVARLRMPSGALCQIAGTRRAVYGYDQRIEVLGAKGALHAENVVESTIVFHGSDGIIGDKPLPFFLERYTEAYRRELDHFVQAVGSGAAGQRRRGSPGPDAGRRRGSIGANRPAGQDLIGRFWRASLQGRNLALMKTRGRSSPRRRLTRRSRSAGLMRTRARTGSGIDRGLGL